MKTGLNASCPDSTIGPSSGCDQPGIKGTPPSSSLQRGSIKRLSCYAVHSYSISLQPCRCGNAFGRSSTKTARTFRPPTVPPNPGSRGGARVTARRRFSQAAGRRENCRHHGFADRRCRRPADAAAHVRLHRFQGVRGVAGRMPRGSHPQEQARGQCGKLTDGGAGEQESRLWRRGARVALALDPGRGHRFAAAHEPGERTLVELPRNRRFGHRAAHVGDEGLAGDLAAAERRQV